MKVDEIDPETGDFRPVAFATEPEVKQFARTKKQEHGTSLENFRLDLEAVASPWNKRAATVFAEGFLEDEEFSCKDHKLIVKTFMRHLPTLRERYRRCNDDEDEESAMTQKDGIIDKARTMRRRNVGSPIHIFPQADIHGQLLNRRRNAFRTFSQMEPAMKCQEALWLNMPPEAMSDDEDIHESGKPRYAIRKLRWRAAAIRPYLQVFDHLHLCTRFTSDNRATPGSFPHLRLVSDREEPPAAQRLGAIAGLPRNFYDPHWLEDLQPYQRVALDVKPEVDIHLPPQITEYVDSSLLDIDDVNLNASEAWLEDLPA